MAKRTGPAASPSAHPRKTKDTSIISVPGKKGPVKANVLVKGSPGSSGR